MALPESVGTGTVVGTFLDLDGAPIVGATVQFAPSPTRLLAVAGSSTILPGRVTATTDAAGQISVELIATDNESLNPTGWTWSVVINIPRSRWSAQPYGFAFELPAGETVDLTTVTPVPVAGGTAMVQGPAGPAGPPGPGGIGGSVVDGQVVIDVPFTPWGIDPDTGPYFDPDGAQPGEEAVLQFDPDTSEPILILIGA